jgi:glycosyltransferase involved in cell wall biosynthesis
MKFVLKQNPFIQTDTVEVCPNSLEPKEISFTGREKQLIREEYNIPMDKTIFIYGGNLGKPQGIDFLIECLKSNEEKDNSFFLIVGAGTDYHKLSNHFSKEKPQNARLLKQLPKTEFEKLTASCDVGLIFLDNRFTIPNFPSRILSYMQASIPVLAATDVNTDIGSVITDGEFGYWCESGDLNKFNELVDKLCDKDLRIMFGYNARVYLNDNYTSKNSYQIIMNHFTQMEEGHKNV